MQAVVGERGIIYLHSFLIGYGGMYIHNAFFCSASSILDFRRAKQEA